MFPYEELRQVAAQLIRDTGREVQLSRLVSTELVDPDRPQLGYKTDTEVLAVMGTFVSTKSMESQFGFSFLSDTFVRKYDQALLVANENPALHSNLEVFDTMVDEVSMFRITGCQKLRPGTLTMLYAFGVEG